MYWQFCLVVESLYLPQEFCFVEWGITLGPQGGFALCTKKIQDILLLLKVFLCEMSYF